MNQDKIQVYFMPGMAANSSIFDSIQLPIDRFEVHNYPNMYILDGSIIPCNLGVNPSLSITALSEFAMEQIPRRKGSRTRSLDKLLKEAAERSETQETSNSAI